MRILHTGDWHIGKRLERFSRLAEQEEVLREIVTIADREKVDLVLVAGDLFDTANPGSEAQELLYRTLEELSAGGRRAVVAIAGNHDSPDRVEAPEVLARRHGIALVGYPFTSPPLFETAHGVRVSASAEGFLELNLPATGPAPVRILTTPYANEYRLRQLLLAEGDERDEAERRSAQSLQEILHTRWKATLAQYCRGEGINLLVAHLLFAVDPLDPPEEPDGERPIAHVGGAPALAASAIPAEIQYTACGHLHRHHSLSGFPSVVYSGSPLAYSFSEAGQEKSVTIVDLEPLGQLGAEPSITTIPLTAGRPLLRKRASSVGEALEWLTAHQEALVELTLVLPEYLSGEERRALHQAHSGIVVIIPILSGGEDAVGTSGEVPLRDPTADVESLFEQFFRDRHGVPPDEALRALFAEVLSVREEDTE
jgi:DNA repair protein SbcD/Mre11